MLWLVLWQWQGRDCFAHCSISLSFFIAHFIGACCICYTILISGLCNGHNALHIWYIKKTSIKKDLELDNWFVSPKWLTGPMILGSNEADPTDFCRWGFTHSKWRGKQEPFPYKFAESKKKKKSHTGLALHYRSKFCRSLFSSFCVILATNSLFHHVRTMERWKERIFCGQHKLGLKLFSTDHLYTKTLVVLLHASTAEATHSLLSNTHRLAVGHLPVTSQSKDLHAEHE